MKIVSESQDVTLDVGTVDMEQLFYEELLHNLFIRVVLIGSDLCPPNCGIIKDVKNDS